MNEHYFCEGSCHGVSDNPGVCQTEDCENKGEELTSCSCDSPEHKGHSEKE